MSLLGGRGLRLITRPGVSLLDGRRLRLIGGRGQSLIGVEVTP